MPKPEVMTEQALIDAAHHLAESREQFIDELRVTVEAIGSVNEQVRALAKFLDARDNKINAGIEIQASVYESLGRLVDLLKENTVALNENTNRLDKFLTKFETYFSTDRGLEFEN